MRRIKIVISVLLIAPLFITTGCKKKTKTCNGVPNIGVSISIDLNQPDYNPITVTGGSMLVSGGNAGIIVYRYQSNVFKAYDCLCPYDGASNSKAVVSIQSNKITGKCAVCGSVFLLSDGSVSSGPSSCPLKAYNATYDGASTVDITN